MIKKAIQKAEHFVVWDLLWKKLFKERYMRSPVVANHHEFSMIYSSADDLSKANDYLLDASLAAIDTARSLKMDLMVQRVNNRFTYPNPNEWPGEHYRLLAGFVKNRKPKVIIEIGTEKGLGTIALKEYAPPDAVIHTFDILPWKSITDHVINDSDITGGTIIQHLDDLSQPEIYAKHRATFEQADFIFVDAAKDGIMEEKFIAHFRTTKFKNRPLIMFDDTKTWNMLKIWRDIDLPKLDLTSFGHFTGTGIVDWNS